jgi:glutaredoxin-like protein NrdH
MPLRGAVSAAQQKNCSFDLSGGLRLRRLSRLRSHNHGRALAGVFRPRFWALRASHSVLSLSAGRQRKTVDQGRDEQMNEPGVVVYTTGPACIRCTMTTRVLEQKGVPFTEVDIRENSAARDYVIEDLGYTEAPVVVVSDEDHWSGFRPEQIDRLIKRAVLPSDAS